jgi:hypothetical protein
MAVMRFVMAARFKSFEVGGLVREEEKIGVKLKSGCVCFRDRGCQRELS